MENAFPLAVDTFEMKETFNKSCMANKVQLSFYFVGSTDL